MALRWIDGFETYGVTPGNNSVGLIGKYTSNFGDATSFTVRAGRQASDFAMRIASSITMIAPTFSNDSTWTVGFGFKQDFFTNEQDILYFNDGGTVQCSVSVSSDGELRVYRGTGGGGGALLGMTAGARLRSGIWCYIEVKIKFNTTTGTVDVCVNGSNVLSLTSKNTAASGTGQASKISLAGSANGVDHTYVDDFYILDSSGSNNTTFLGPQKVTAVLPSADGGTLQWTPNSGSNHYDRVNENPHDSSTSYLSDSTSGHVDVWSKSATVASIANIKGIQQNTVFETDSGSAFSVIQRLVSGGTTSDDSGTAGTNGTYKTASRVIETDPNTGSLWTQANLDSATIGIKVA